MTGKVEAKTDWKRSALASAVGLVIGGGAVAAYYSAASPAGSDRAEVEQIVKDYILAHGEILPEAMQRLQQREASRAVGQHRAELETPFHGGWAGAPNADVVLVEFFDYACGFCRASNADINRLLSEDRRLKIVWRELPVLGPDSEAAARVSLAAARQGKYPAFYQRLFALGRPTRTNVERAAQETGIDVAQASGFAGSQEVRAELQRNFEMARTLGASGTPTLIVGDQGLQGAVGYDRLKQAIDETRAGRRT